MPLRKHVDGVETDMTPEEEAEFRRNLPGESAIPKLISLVAFLEKIPKAKRAALRKAARQDDDVEDWLQLLQATPNINLKNQSVIDGVNLIKTKGIITNAEAQTILE